MTQLPLNPGFGVDELERTFTLSELLDLDLYREICASFASLIQVGFRVMDDSRQLLVDAKGRSAESCSALLADDSVQQRCVQEVSRILEKEPEGPWDQSCCRHDCFLGLRYLIAKLFHEGTPIGRVILGPYLPRGQCLGIDGDPDALEIGCRDVLGEKITCLDEADAQKALRHLVRMTEGLIFVGYKSALTSRMHLESVSASFADLKEKNRALRESYEQLKELDRLKSNFLATVSHELRTPLTSVIGYSEMLLEGMAGRLAEEQHAYVTTIMEKGEQLLGLISSILDFSKLERGCLKLSLQPTDIVEVTQSALSTVVPMASRQEIHMDVRVADDAPREIVADEGKVRQVLVNILGNAIKFNKKQGSILIRLQRFARPVCGPADEDVPAVFLTTEEECVCIEVEDTGIGIPAHELTRIFDSFYQVDGSSTREYGGTGLGLAIAKGITLAHGGFIEVESEVGKGSVFRVILPVTHGP